MRPSFPLRLPAEARMRSAGIRRADLHVIHQAVRAGFRGRSRRFLLLFFLQVRRGVYRLHNGKTAAAVMKNVMTALMTSPMAKPPGAHSANVVSGAKTDDWRQKTADNRVDNCRERRCHNDTDGHVQHIAARNKLLELFQ
jgi:hypothetical protein